MNNFSTKLRLSPVFFTMALLVLLLIGVSPGALAQGTTLRVGMEVPTVLDPATMSNDPEIALNRAVRDYLIDVKPDSSLAPNLATNWTISDDGLTYTFELAEGVTFHDGSPFTSADVVFTFNRLKELKSNAMNLLGEFDVAADGDNKVTFTLTKPNADFLYGLGSRWAVILKDGTANPGEDFNGTGPFTIESLDANAGGRTVFVKNPNYWKAGQPILDRMEHIYFAGDAVTQLDAIRSGQVDLIYKVPIAQVKEGVPDGLTVIEQQTSQHGVIRLRTDTGPGQDVRVRQAFKYATNRDELNDLLLFGRGTVGHNDPIAPSYGVFYDKDIVVQPYDPQKACSLLTEAGYPDGLEMTLHVPIAFEYPDMAVILRDQWAEGCIRVEVETHEAGLYYDTSNEINYCDVELGITGWGSRPTPQAFLLEGYVSSAINEHCVSGYNESHWSNPELDDLVAQAGVTADTAERARIYGQIAEIFNEEGPIIVPYFANMIGVVRDNVTGLVLDPFPGSIDYRAVSIGS